MVENAELQPSYGGNQANIKTVLKKQNKTVKGGLFLQKYQCYKKAQKKKINLPQYSRLKEAKDT